MALRAISSMATRHLLQELSDAAATAGLPRVEVTSMGGVVAAEKVAAGEPVGLVVLAADALERLASAGHVLAASVTPLVLSQVAVAVPDSSVAAAERPGGAAFTDADGVRAALLGARRVGYSTGPSGSALVRLIEDWGLPDELGDRLVQARAGVPVAASLASGDVDLGFQQLSELVGAPGVRIRGVMPPDCAIDTVFAGAVAATAADPKAAASVLAFWASDAVASAKQGHAFSVPGSAAGGGTVVSTGWTSEGPAAG